MEGLHIFNFEVLISKKISWTVNGMHPHGNAAAHVPAPLPSKEGPAPHLREKGQRHQGLTAFFKASLLLSVNQISPPRLTARVLRERSQRRGSQTPGAPHTSGRQRVGEQTFPVQGAQSSPGCPAAQSAQGLLHEPSLDILSLRVNLV